MDLVSAYVRRLPLRKYKAEHPAPHVTRWFVPDLYQTAEVEMPWVVYTYGRIHDSWWPLWRSSKVLGRAAVGVECAVCGENSVIVAKMPRFADIGERPKHPERIRFMLAHIHKDRGHPMSWSKPLLNMNAHQGELNLDLLAMRLEADLRINNSDQP